MTEEARRVVHELADAIVNPAGYADDPGEADVRAERRDRLEIALVNFLESA